MTMVIIVVFIIIIKSFLNVAWIILIIIRPTDGVGKYISENNEDVRVWAGEQECLESWDAVWKPRVTVHGRSFHVQAPKTGKARLPTVETTETRTGGTARRPQPLSWRDIGEARGAFFCGFTTTCCPLVNVVTTEQRNPLPIIVWLWLWVWVDHNSGS